MESMNKDEMRNTLQNQKDLGVEEIQALRNLLDIMGVINPYKEEEKSN